MRLPDQTPDRCAKLEIDVHGLRAQQGISRSATGPAAGITGQPGIGECQM